MFADAWAGQSRGRTLAIAASILAHGLVLLLLVWRLGGAPAVQEPPVMSLQLTRLRPHARRPPVEARRDRVMAAPRAASTPERPPPLLPDAHELPVPATPSPQAGAEALRPALRRLLGCQASALVGLSREEREHCRDGLGAQAVQAQGQPGARLTLDPRGRYAVDPTAYLNRRPHNGCKVSAGGDAAPNGKEGAAGGVQCGLSF